MSVDHASQIRAFSFPCVATAAQLYSAVLSTLTIHHNKLIRQEAVPKFGQYASPAHSLKWAS